jgi:hypothetical protein
METATISSTAETLKKLEKFKFEISQKTGRETITFNIEDIDIEKDKMFKCNLPDVIDLLLVSF